jgi:hypothetical protein
MSARLNGMTEAVIASRFRTAVYSPPNAGFDPWLLVVWEGTNMTAIPYPTEAEALAHMALKRLEFARREAKREKLAAASRHARSLT